MLSTVIGVAAQEVPATEDPIIMTINGDPVFKSEFEYIFKKNNRETEVTKEALDEYIDLFVNFKLKVREADDMEMDTIAKFIRELQGYRDQLAKPYLVDSERIDELVAEAYERTKWEIRASHILIKCDENAAPEDTLKAYERIMYLRDSIMNGASFEAVAAGKGGSEDPSVTTNKGDLGYFTAFKMVYPFETAAYTTEVGEVSMPIRTRFGYHILYVADKRPARGEVQVAHIMVQSREEDADSLKEIAYQRIMEIYELTATTPFDELARSYSDDKQSARNGGDLGWFGAGKMVPAFDSTSFAMQTLGDISEPFQTGYGWHIVKLIDKKGIPSFEESENILKNKVSRDNRSQLSKKSFIVKLRDEYDFTETDNLKYLRSELDTMVFYAEWEAPDNRNMGKTLFTFADSTVTVGDLADFIVMTQRKDQISDLDAYLDLKYQTFANVTLTQYEDALLEEKYPEFRMLMKEYRDGILLFELTEQKVWGKAMKDSTGLQEFYEANLDSFMYEQRIDVSIFKCKDSKLAAKAQKYLKKGKSDDFIVDKLNKDSQLNLYIETGRYEKGDHDIADMFAWEEGVSETQELNGQVVFVRVNEVLEPTPKELSEARGLVTAKYQKFLEEEWITTLRETYEVEVFEDVLYSIK